VIEIASAYSRLQAGVERRLGPALAGAVVTWLDGGSVRAWARQIVRLRVAPRRFLATFLLPLLVVGLASVAISFFDTNVDLAVLSGRLSLVLGSEVFAALIGGRNEEPGWRGFARPRLEERYTPVPATLSLGAFWHLPHLVADPNAVHSFAWLVEDISGVVRRIIKRTNEGDRFTSVIELVIAGLERFITLLPTQCVVGALGDPLHMVGAKTLKYR
jgi:hypothetical protein